MIENEATRHTHVVTGAAGFIGSHLVERLLREGRRVIGIDNFALGTPEHLAQAMAHENFAFCEVDLNDDVSACQDFLQQQAASNPIRTVWHLAANSDIQAGGREPDVDLHLTFLTTFNVLKWMEELSIPEIVFASSSAIYGEHDGLLVEETGPLFPISNYGAMKLASEAVISAALERFLKRAWICRFPNVVGSRATHGIIFDFLKKLRANPAELEVLGDGTQVKPYLHVSELIEAMLFIVRNSTQRLNYYNIAPAVGATTVKEIAEAVVRAAAPGARIHYTGGKRGWVGDVSKFNYGTAKLQSLGWTPKLSSNDAVALAIQENVVGNSSR